MKYEFYKKLDKKYYKNSAIAIRDSAVCKSTTSI